MFILGIDPGVQNIGLALYSPYEKIPEKKYIYLNTYHVTEKNKLKKEDTSYVDFFHHLVDLIVDFNLSIEYVAIEKPFFLPQTLANNIRTLELIGIIKLACQSTEYNIPWKEYSPMTIKKVLTGNGKAKKEDIINTINSKFNLNLESSHIADACAVAYTYFEKEVVN